MGSMTRVSRPREAARETYNALSRWYDLIAAAAEAPARRQGLDLLSAQPGERILEIGYGTGHALVALARAVGRGGYVYGVDISDGMAQIAAQRLRRSDLMERVGLSVGDAAHRHFVPNAFDAVFMSFTLELFDTPDIPVVLRHCRASLRPGGRIGVVALSRLSENLAVLIYEWLHRQIPRWVDCRPIFARRMLKSVGFQITQTRARRMWGLPVEIVVAEKRS